MLTQEDLQAISQLIKEDIEILKKDVEITRDVTNSILGCSIAGKQK